MHKVEIILKLIFDKLGVSSEIHSLEDRKRLQKTIYLANAVGVGNNYSFGWYAVGPYSPELMIDCHRLSNDISRGDYEYKKYKLNPYNSSKLEPITDLMHAPTNVNLPQEDWLELLTSILYLTKEQNYNTNEIIEKMKPTRSQLLVHFESGLEQLRKHGLIDT